MNEGDRWVYFDGPEPDHVRAVLDVLRQEEAATSATPEEDAQFEREFFERLHAQTAGGPALLLEEEEDEGSAATTKPRGPWGLPPPGPEPANEGGATARCPVLDDRRDAPPVVEEKAPEPVAEAPARAGVPRPPERLASTAGIPPGLPKVTLPFVLPEQVPAAKKCTLTKPVPVMKRSGLAATTPVGDDTISRAVPATPFPGSAATVVMFPGLLLEQYASLWAELSVYPEHAEKIRGRYYVGNQAAQGALDAYWAARFAEEAGLREAFEWKYWEFVGWMRWQRG